MSRTHSSVLSQGSSVLSSSSGASSHTAPESPRSVYPEMQARASDARGSETRRFSSNWWYSSPLEIVHDEEEEEGPSIIKLPPRRDHESESETSESESEYSNYVPEVQRPNVSQPCLSDYTIDLSNSISNQDHRSNADSIPQFASRSQYFSTNNRYVDSRFHESADGAWMRLHKPHVRIQLIHLVRGSLQVHYQCTHHPHRYPTRQEHAANHSDNSDQRDSLGPLRDLSTHPTPRALFSATTDPKDLLAYYSEEASVIKQGRGVDDDDDGGGGGENSRPEAYDDDFEEPFAPRGYSDSDRESCREDWDNRQDRGRE